MANGRLIFSLGWLEPGSGAANAENSKRQIGVVSATFLVFNRMIGTGIFATPSNVLKLSGSVGLALCMWVVGMIVTAAGMAVYLEFGTAIPRNGGEKNYLEFVYRRPKFLATGFYTGYGVKTMPQIREGLEEDRFDEAQGGVRTVSAAVNALAAQVQDAAQALQKAAR